MMNELKPLLGKLSLFAKDKFSFSRPPRLFLKKDAQNSKMPLGKTAHYDPANQSVTLYISSRHPKDILRSYAHELIHHIQNLRGDLSPEKMGSMGSNYAQDNDHMRNMEKEAYLQGNMCFRDWEDSLSKDDKIKYKLAESKFFKENNKLNNKTLKQIIRNVISEQMTLDDLGKGIRANKKAREDQKAADAAAKASKEKKAGEDRRKAFFKKAFGDASVAASREKEKEERRVKNNLEKQKKAQLAAIDNPEKGADIEYLKRLGDAGKEELDKRIAQKNKITKAFDDQIAALDKAKTKADVVAIARLGVDAKLPSQQGIQATADTDTAIASGTPSYGMGTGGDAPIAGYPDDEPVAAEPSPVVNKLSRREIIVKGRQQARILRNRNIVATVGDFPELQKRLVNLGHMPETTPRGSSSIDGKYGQMTHDAIVKLQNSVGIEGDDADGVAGPATVRAIRGNPAVMMRFKMAAKRKLDESNNKENEKMKEDKTKMVAESENIEENAFVLAADAAADAGKKEFEFPEGSGKMHKVRLKKGGDTIQDEKETKSEGAQPPPHPFDIEDEYGSAAAKPQGASAPVQDVLKMISKISSDGKITGEELVAAGKKIMQQAKGSNYRDSQEYRDDYAANKDQLDYLADYQNEEKKIQTPEQENTIYENRFNKRNNRLFDKLINKWTK